MRWRSTIAISVLLGLCSALLLPSSAPAQISDELSEQIRLLRADKAARTPVERKISSQLLYADRIRRGQPIVPGMPTLRTGVEIAADGTTAVDIAADVSAELLAQIPALGGVVIDSQPRYRTLRARIPIDALRTLAALDTVSAVRPAGRATTRKTDTSEGDTAHRADLMRTTYNVDGTGIAIGVLSDGVDSLAALQGTGDLPPSVNVLTGQAGSGSEGTAMLEIMHDLAARRR